MSTNGRHRLRVIRHQTPVAQGLAATIGNFDGVHLGHQKLLRAVRQKQDLAAAVITFQPHPLKILRPDRPLHSIHPWRNKYRHLERAGIDYLYVLRFSAALAKQSAENFAAVLFRTLKVRRLIVGENFVYGRDAKGNIESLRQAATAHGATVEAAPLLTLDGETVSSGRIRRHLTDGDFAQAARLLGAPFTLEGRVIRGAGRGRRWGVPTANLHLTISPPCRGIFAAFAWVNGTAHPAAVSIGTNPSVTTSQRLRTEAHLLDFSADLYGQRLSLQPLQPLRDEIFFPDTEALKEAIRRDIDETRAICAAHSDATVHRQRHSTH